MKSEPTGQREWQRAFDTIDLQRLQLGQSFSYHDDFVLHAAELKEWRDAMLRRMIISLKGYVWAEPPKRLSVKYPATWWDAFKDRWFPEWAKEAYPINYTVETMEGQIFYPKLPQTVPEHAWNLRMVIEREASSVPNGNESSNRNGGFFS